VSEKNLAKAKIEISNNWCLPEKLPASKKHKQMVMEKSEKSYTRQYDSEKINDNEKKKLCTWHESLINRPGVTGSMVNCLEMIVKFSMGILNEQDVEVSPCITWMDGVVGKDSLQQDERGCDSLKFYSFLCVLPGQKIKSKYLDDFINGPEFLLESIALLNVCIWNYPED